MRQPIPFHKDLLPRVADFCCGPEVWEQDVAAWIKAPREDNDGALVNMDRRGTSVWLYEADDGDLIGYASLGRTRWYFNVNGKEEQRPVQIIPYIGVREIYKGKPVDAPREHRYGRRILADVLAEAAERCERRKEAPILGLYVHPKNERALTVYEQSGFRRLGFDRYGNIRMYVNVSPQTADWVLFEPSPQA